MPLSHDVLVRFSTSMRFLDHQQRHWAGSGPEIELECHISNCTTFPSTKIKGDQNYEKLCSSPGRILHQGLFHEDCGAVTALVCVNATGLRQQLQCALHSALLSAQHGRGCRHWAVQGHASNPRQHHCREKASAYEHRRG